MSYLGRSAKLSLKAQEKVSFLATAGQTVKTGLSYTPSFIEVYVNGVLLTDTTDFTATNGSSVTFTVALLLNDEVTVISLKTFTVADHYSKTEADTLLAAKSPLASPSFTGTLNAPTVSASVRLDTDLIKSKTNTPLSFQLSDGTAVGNFSNTTGALISNYGLAVGGTGAANTLSDYETGTWTPTIRGSGTLTIAAIEAAHYTKIGSVVVLQTYLSLANNGNSTDMEISGMPFINGGTSVNANQYSMGGVAHGGGANMTEMKYCRTQSNTNYLTIYKKASTNVPQTDVQGNYFLISITYRTTD